MKPQGGATVQLTMPKITKAPGYFGIVGISSKHIMTLLESRHSKDVIITECKNGETWGARDLLKLDAWVLCRSYSPLRTIGYEIKTSRQDFERDKKWEKYLDLCHEFYFVCPAGLIRTHDLPKRVGIVWASKDRLFTKRHAERVEPSLENLNNLLIYVVMARSQIVANMFDRDAETPPNMLEQKRRWVEEANAKKELALFIKGHIRQAYDHIIGLDLTFKQREDHIERFREALESLGIIWNPEDNSWSENSKVENEIRELKKRVNLRTIRSMRSLAQSLSETADSLEPIVKANS